MLTKSKKMPSVYRLIFLVFLLPLLYVSCNQNAETQSNQPKKNIKEPLIKINKKLVRTEDERIQEFIDRYGWEMSETGSGLRYLVYHEGNGTVATTGKIAVIKYSVGLLNGDTLYTSREEGPKEFLIGKGGVESGLEEGILLLKQGDRAKFIIPSHLAFGLVGDGNKIPAKATLVYDVELTKIK
jgi:FKBP-type peptidyl-prolyl cis-trans isomerase